MKQRSIGYVGALVLAMAPMVGAQQPTPPERQTPPEQSGVRVENRTVEGEVVELNAQKLVVRTTDGNRMTFSVDRDLTVGATPIAVGQRVRVEYRSGVDPIAVVTVTRIPGSDVVDKVEETAGASDVADAVEDAADEVEDAIDDDDANDRAAEPARVPPARVAPAPATTARMQDPARQAPAQTDELPDTASPLPALVLAGLALLGSGFGLSARRRD